MKAETKYQPAQVKSLAELKRLIKPSTELKATYHSKHTGIVGLTRVITDVQSNAFYSVIKDQPEHEYSQCNRGRGFRSDIEKASCYEFDGTTIRVFDDRKNDGSVLYEMEVYPNDNRLTGSPDEANEDNGRLSGDPSVGDRNILFRKTEGGL